MAELRPSSEPTWPRWERFEWDVDNDVLLREVRPGLWVGSELARDNYSWLAVVDLYGSSRLVTTRRELSWRISDDIPIQLGLLDTTWPFVFHALKKGDVLIHCKAGLSRSASVAYAILRRLDRLDHEEALRRVRVPEDTMDAWPSQPVIRSAREWVWRHR